MAEPKQGSYAAWLSVMAVAWPVWAGIGLKLGVQAIFTPHKYFKKTNWAALSFKDPPNVLHKFYDVNGIRLHTAESGASAAGKPLILFLHGFPETWFSWRHQLQAFAATHHCVAMDLRGYGQSSCPKGSRAYQMDCLLGDVEGLIAILGYTKCILVAHDWGGNIAWHLAALKPQLIEKLVILGTPHPKAYEDKACFNSQQQKRSWYMLLFQNTAVSRSYFCHSNLAQLDTMLTPSRPMGPCRPDAISTEDLQRFKQAFARPGCATAAMQYYQASVDLVTRHPIPAIARAIAQPITVPALVIRGDIDAFFLESMYSNLQTVATTSTLLTIKDCSHWIQQDRPEEVNAAIQRYLEDGKPATLPRIQASCAV